MKLSSRLLHLFICCILAGSCTPDTTAVVTATSVTEMVPLQVGKYITYRMDSTVFTNTGITIETHSYLVKHTVQDMTTAGDGSKTYTIQRVITDPTAANPWINNGSYHVTVFSNRVETVDNNLRVISLAAPISLNNTWMGNSYLIGPNPSTGIDASPYSDIYDMEADNDMKNWQFAYTAHGDTSVQNTTYNNVWTVTQANAMQNIPPATGTSYGYKNVGIEKYAKGVGLIYKKLEVYEFQGPHAGNPQNTYTGFGVTMWAVDHN